MTDALPGFTFDQKTGELSRGGKVIALKLKHARLFALLLTATGDDEYVPTRDLCDAIDGIKSDVANQTFYLRRRLLGIGMTIEGRRGEGYRLVVGEMPKKWQPTIPPVTDDPSLLKMPT